MPRLELNIEVDGALGADDDSLHVTGTVRPEGGEEVAFVGWVSLLSLLQQALATEAPRVA